MSSGFLSRYLIVPLGMAACAATAQAEVKTPAVFTDHMVLQRGLPAPVWGWADPGEAVTVRLAGKEWTTKAAADGRWLVRLDAMEANATPMELVVAGTNTLTFKDVLVGDVWICSGQSNMEWNLGNASNAAEELPQSANPNIRLFMVTKKTAFAPVQDCKGAWNVCGPDTAKPFSAVGYFFGKELNRDLKVPIGLIGTNWGGTPAQAWTSIEGLQGEASLKDLADKAASQEADLPKQMEIYTTKTIPHWEEAMQKWKATVEVAFKKDLEEWKKQAAQAKADGKPEPVKPEPKSQAPRKPNAPDNNPNGPTVLFNGMIAPLLPYGIKGAIWYQGESNAGNPGQYATLFPAMIRNWRAKWGQGEFPFFFVQLANFKPRVDAPVEEKSWAELREAQLKTLSLTNTGMAVIIDIGEGGNIHPKDKLNVGRRLALSARKVAYGQDVVHSGPIFASMKVDGGKAVLSFDHVGAGLVIGSAPVSKEGEVQAKPLDTLKGFAIAGADKKFVRAAAAIVGSTVVVHSDEVKEPVAVRYGWANNPEVNLYNKEGLPASPFRTDPE